MPRTRIFLAAACLAAAVIAGGALVAASASSEYKLKGGSGLSFRPGPASVKFSKGEVRAPPERVFGLVADFRKWSSWSPHERADPAMRRTYGRPNGKGATYEWSGNEAVGAGRARIVESVDPKKLVVEFEFSRPVAGRLTVAITVGTSDGSTDIAVATSGPAELVVSTLNMFFGGDNLFGITCAAEEPKAPTCKFMSPVGADAK